MVLRRDFIQRMIEQLAAVLAATLNLRRAGAHEEATRQLEEAARALVGLDLRMLEGLDPGAVAGLVGEAERLVVLARLCHERAEVARDAGSGAEGAWRRRAAELWLEAAGRGAPLDAEARGAIDAIAEGGLSARAERLRSGLPPA